LRTFRNAKLGQKMRSNRKRGVFRGALKRKPSATSIAEDRSYPWYHLSLPRKAASGSPERLAGCIGPSPSRPTACIAGFCRATPKGIPSDAFAALQPPAALWEGKTDVLVFITVLGNISTILPPSFPQVKHETKKTSTLQNHPLQIPIYRGICTKTRRDTAPAVSAIYRQMPSLQRTPEDGCPYGLYRRIAR